MQHPFVSLQPELDHLLSIVQITRRAPVEEGIHRIVKRGLDVYRELAEQVRPVPALLLAALDLREGDCNPHTGIGQGDRWDRVSTHVPRGKGPFENWLQANIYYINYDHLGSMNGLVPVDHPALWAFWAVYKPNAWNGWGPNGHGRHSGYPWSCTNVYDCQTDGVSPGGKYVADGKWNPNVLDEQPGTVPVMMELAKVYPDLAFAPLPMMVTPPPIVPPPDPVPLGVPVLDGAETVQVALNRLLALDPPLLVDGNYGRMTRQAVRSFQRAHGLATDGIVGPSTVTALKAALAAAEANP
jgi:lysozyme family protein